MLGSKSRLVLDTCGACSGFLRFERERKEKKVDGSQSGSTEGFIQTCGMRKWFVVLCERENI